MAASLDATAQPLADDEASDFECLDLVDDDLLDEVPPDQASRASQAPASFEDAETPSAGERDDESDLDDDTDLESSPAAAEAAPARARRRRRRRGKRSSSVAGPEAAASPAAASAPPEDAEEPAADADLGEEDDAAVSLGKNHKTIHSWNEVVDILVSANLEARARNPRGHGRRGGRDRRGR